MRRRCVTCHKNFEVDEVLCTMLKIDTAKKMVRCDACYMELAV